MFTGQAPEGGPIGDPFDFHGEPYLPPPQYVACEAPCAIFSFLHLCSLARASMRGNREMSMENNTRSKQVRREQNKRLLSKKRRKISGWGKDRSEGQSTIHH